MSKRKYVVRVVTSQAEAEKWGMFLEQLRYMGLIKLHRNDETSCFDLFAPYGVDSEVWAEQNAERMASFGINAVKAPMWLSGSHSEVKGKVDSFFERVTPKD